MNDKKPESQWRFRPEEETHDIYKIHRQAFREPPEPREGLEPPPWWLWAVSVILIFWGGFYLGRYGGIFGPYPHVLEEKRILGSVEIARPPLGGTNRGVDGGEVYARICVSCHQPNGQGIVGAFPPLAGSDWLLKDPETPIRIVLHGLQGSIEVKGMTYNGVMPEWGSRLSDEEIAAVLTHERRSWGNSAEEITSDMVDRIRKETANRTTPWTPDELQRLGGLH